MPADDVFVAPADSLGAVFSLATAGLSPIIASYRGPNIT